MKIPSKNKQYKSKTDSSLWEIWEGEDLFDKHILLFNRETGDDFSCKMVDFWKFFEEIS